MYGTTIQRLVLDLDINYFYLLFSWWQENCFQRLNLRIY